MQSINTLALVDKAIGTLKQILSSYNLTQWAESLKKATEVYNSRSHEHLLGSAPEDVKGSQEMQYELLLDDAEKTKHNNQKWRAKAGKLKDQGAFRVPLDRETWERIDQPKFAGEVHEMPDRNAFKGSNVEDVDGKSFPVKTILPVPSGSADVDLDIDSGPGAGKRVKQREMLQDYARNLKDWLPSTGLTLSKVTQLLNGMRGFQDTTDVYGPAKEGRIVSFLKLYPQYFNFTGKGPKIKVFPTPPPDKSSKPERSIPTEPRERQPRNLEVDPRAAYRRFPNEQRVEYKDQNPARIGTPRFRRYESYKFSHTIGAARRLGATSQDISQDLRAGALTLL